MLKEYIQAAMESAEYKLESNNDKPYFGFIPNFEGVCAEGHSLTECQRELETALEEWIILRIQMNYPLPSINGIKINLSTLSKPPLAA
jgi:predicted RNase H-like HicB family nuclease